jgi:transcriptional regulator with XRE-family HTH domain
MLLIIQDSMLLGHCILFAKWLRLAIKICGKEIFCRMSIQATRLRDRRKALGINQAALAVLIGVNQGQISRYESGETIPSSDILAALARALQTSADWLLGLEEERKPDFQVGELTLKEREAVTAWRCGQRLQAIQIIILDE